MFVRIHEIFSGQEIVCSCTVGDGESVSDGLVIKVKEMT